MYRSMFLGKYYPNYSTAANRTKRNNLRFVQSPSNLDKLRRLMGKYIIKCIRGSSTHVFCMDYQLFYMAKNVHRFVILKNNYPLSKH